MQRLFRAFAGASGWGSSYFKIMQAWSFQLGLLYLHSDAGTRTGRLEVAHAGGAAGGGLTIMSAALAEYMLVEDLPRGSHLYQLRQ